MERRDNFNVTMENNRIMNNQYNGINYELSYNAMIGNNLIEGNGFRTLSTTPLEGWGSCSSNSCCTRSPVTLSSTIATESASCNRTADRARSASIVTESDSVSHNRIIMSRGGETGMIAWVPHAQPFYTSMRNRFSLNDYVLRCRTRPFVWSSRRRHASLVNVATWRALERPRRPVRGHL